MTVVAETKVEMPEDVKQAADAVWQKLASGLIGFTDMRQVETEIIARAILSERERCATLVKAMLTYADTTSGADEAIPAAIMEPDHWLARNPELASSIRSGAKP